MTTITALPDPPNRATDDAATFSSKADTFLAALQTFCTETNLVATETNTASSGATAAASAASSSAAVSAWAGTTVSYSRGNAVWSGVNFKTYRLSITSKAANVANTDPSIDTASWALVNGTGDVIATAVQTLTNKTLASPAVTGVINNAVGTAALPSYTFTGDTNTGAWRPGADVYGISTAGVERLRLDASGNLGIGTTNPAQKLVVSNVGAAGLEIGPIAVNSAPAVVSYNRSGAAYLQLTSIALQHVFQSGATPTESMRIDNIGNVGVGINAPTARLHVSSGSNKWATLEAGSVGASFMQFQQGGSASVLGYLGSDGAAALSGGTGTNLAIRAENALLLAAGGNVERMRIDGSGNVGVGVQAPENRLQVSFTSTAPSLSGAAGSGLSLLASNTLRLNVGSDSVTPFAGWFQASNGSGSSFPLVINPLGGSVGVGTRNPSNQLHAAGITRISDATNSTAITVDPVTTAGLTSIIAQFGGSQLALGSAAIERMRIDSSGNLGVGINAPAARLHVESASIINGLFRNTNAASYTSLRMYNDQNGAGRALEFEYAGSTYASALLTGGPTGESAAICTTGAYPLVLGTSGTARMMLDSGGNVLIGTTGSGPLNSNSMCFGPASTGGADLNHVSGTASGVMYARFNLAGTTIGSITQSGTTAVLYNTTSDSRLKTNIKPAADAGVLLDAVQVRQFDWLAEGVHQRYGFIAQELQKVVPEAVHAPAGPDEMMAVDYSKLVPLLVREIQSLRARVALLEV